jgi:hypothetical protein
MRRNSVKLSSRHKFWFYLILLLIYGSGLGWAYFRYTCRSTDELGYEPHRMEPWLLKVHGAAAMGFLIVLGTLLPGHIRFAWHARRNRPNGIMLIMFVAFLVLTGYGLYYFGNEQLRSWTNWSHLIVGLTFPGILVLHIWSGRRTAP